MDVADLDIGDTTASVAIGAVGAGNIERFATQTDREESPAIDHARVMLSFEGTTVPRLVSETLAANDVAGITLFRPNNYEDAAQLRSLNNDLQTASGGELPLLIAIDQEGGQLHAFGAPATRWPGNMALGAVDDPDLTREVGVALGQELRAVGINVNYAPVADLATNPINPATGARAFGEGPALVSRHVSAMIEGLQSVGVAATMKHFPGKGDSEVDSHHAMPTIPHDLDHLARNEFAPFRAAIEAGVKLAMTGHFALPGLSGRDDLPCTVSKEANTRLLRDEMGFEGVLITDALDMKALRQGAFQIIDIIAAVDSGVDLLLLTADPEQEERATLGLELAISRGLISQERLLNADERVQDLRSWVAGFPTPSLDVVGSADHTALAQRVAEKAITLVVNDAGLIPIDPLTTGTVLVIEPDTSILTPADTSDLESPRLAIELRSILGDVVESIIVPHDPLAEHVTNACGAVANADVVVIGTAAASLSERQTELVRAIHGCHENVIVVAQRTPWDLNGFEDVSTYLCSWAVNPVNARAAARALTGLAPITGRSPVSIGRFPVGTGHDLP